MENKQRMNSDIEYVEEICSRYSYPDGTFEALRGTYESLSENSADGINFFKWLSYYEDGGELTDEVCRALLNETAGAAAAVGESEYTVHLLLLILMSRRMHELYRDANISDDIFYDSLADLKWKLYECLRMHGIAGTFVAYWHLRFYKMKLFALGRLQFEIKKFGNEFSVCGVDLHEDDDVIGVHIPSGRRLIREEYLESYRRAEKFFSDIFKGGKTVFTCDSWLLFPEHKTMLPEDSGIRIFMEDYSIVKARYSKPLERPWPIFYEKRNAPADQLPQNTSLEKAYVERYKKGLPSGSALGVIIFENGIMLNNEGDKMA